MDVFMLSTDISLVLTDWCEEDEAGPMGYSTIHIARETKSNVSMCDREGLAYDYYTPLLSHDDPALCESCKSIAVAFIVSILEEDPELEEYKNDDNY